jgi:hypothetical protein
MPEEKETIHGDVKITKSLHSTFWITFDRKPFGQLNSAQSVLSEKERIRLTEILCKKLSEEETNELKLIVAKLDESGIGFQTCEVYHLDDKCVSDHPLKSINK